MSVSIKTMTVANGQTNSNEVSFSDAGGVYPSAIVTPAVVTGTIFRLQRAVVEGGVDVWKNVRAPGSGADNPLTLSANAHIPIDTETMRSLKGQRIRIVTATAQGQSTAFTLEYEQL